MGDLDLNWLTLPDTSHLNTSYASETARARTAPNKHFSIGLVKWGVQQIYPAAAGC